MNNDNKLLHVIIRTPKQILYEGDALAVSSTNTVGKFDILPQHANFITMTVHVPVIILTPKKETLTFHLPLSIIYNSENTVKVYTDIGSHL